MLTKKSNVPSRVKADTKRKNFLSYFGREGNLYFGEAMRIG